MSKMPNDAENLSMDTTFDPPHIFSTAQDFFECHF
jgi:hypothetical protein